METGADGAWPGHGEGPGVGGTTEPCSVPSPLPKIRLGQPQDGTSVRPPPQGMGSAVPTAAPQTSQRWR